jgi:hypothetical protein
VEQERDCVEFQVRSFRIAQYCTFELLHHVVQLAAFLRVRASLILEIFDEGIAGCNGGLELRARTCERHHWTKFERQSRREMQSMRWTFAVGCVALPVK